MKTSRPVAKKRSAVHLELGRAGAGALAIGAAIALSSVSMARAGHPTPAKSKIFRCSSGTACLEGSASGGSTLGILGISGAIAVEGLTNATNGDSAIAGVQFASAGGGPGVYGSSAAGPGVYGLSTKMGSAGVAGYEFNASGNGGNAVFAESADNTGAFSTMYVQGDNTGTWLFTATNLATLGSCTIDPDGNIFCSGSAEMRNLRTHHLNSSGQRVLAYAAESASATLEDVGTGRMVGGIATVGIDRAFGSTIDRSAYHVFLTPDGDASLYVAQKNPSGFIVRETRGGRATLDFEYRIIGRPLDAKNDRLPLAPPVRKPQRAHRSR
jgi:hypothetical protein